MANPEMTKMDELIKDIDLRKKQLAELGNWLNPPDMRMARQFFEAVDEAVEDYGSKMDSQHFWQKWEKLKEILK